MLITIAIVAAIGTTIGIIRAMRSIRLARIGDRRPPASARYRAWAARR